MKWIFGILMSVSMLLCFAMPAGAEDASSQSVDTSQLTMEERMAMYYASAGQLWEENLVALAEAGVTPHYLWGEGNTPDYDESHGGREPALYIYQPEGVEPRGCVIVNAGGGFRIKSYYEAMPVAQFYADNGYVAAILDYRVHPYETTASTMDGQRAVRYMRYHADEYNFDSDKIIVCGFSAGGRLNAYIALDDAIGIDASDPIDAMDSRPNAVISGYGSVTASDYENKIDENTPPFFLWVSTGDQTIPPAQVIGFASMLLEKGTTVELHVFSEGEHGIGLGVGEEILTAQYPHAASWAPLSLGWLESIGF